MSKAELGDPRFLNSVSLLCLHDEEGSLALVLNHPLPLYINPNDFTIQEEHAPGHFPLYRGGPVGPEQCMFLFKGKATKHSIAINPNLHLGTNTETLDELKSRGALEPDHMKFFLGYAGWSFYQLDCENSNGSWYTHPSNNETPFSSEKNLWLETLKKLGPEFYAKGKKFLDSDLN